MRIRVAKKQQTVTPRIPLPERAPAPRRVPMPPVPARPTRQPRRIPGRGGR
ncbi:hypothetical protein ABZ470_28690 [Streptosporangium sp. NPDC020072]|uniref:hypothetical protein n=1 Tax=unclassified Streptosporangium TaxID=2632669 RepID=UPI003448C593